MKHELSNKKDKNNRVRQTESRQRKNRALLALLLLFVGVVYALSIVKYL